MSTAFRDTQCAVSSLYSLRPSERNVSGLTNCLYSNCLSGRVVLYNVIQLYYIVCVVQISVVVFRLFIHPSLFVKLPTVHTVSFHPLQHQNHPPPKKKTALVINIIAFCDTPHISCIKRLSSSVGTELHGWHILLALRGKSLLEMHVTFVCSIKQHFSVIP